MNANAMIGLVWQTLPKAATAGLVLFVITAAVEHGSPILAAMGATTPVTLPFSLYIVVEQALQEEQERSDLATAKVDRFLLLACKGMVATLAWCVGALVASRAGYATSFWWLMVYGYGTWAVVWKVLQTIHP
jgi:hypothetical protein